MNEKVRGERRPILSQLEREKAARRTKGTTHFFLRIFPPDANALIQHFTLLRYSEVQIAYVVISKRNVAAIVNHSNILMWHQV